mgnify:CR=1 FL=1
MPDTVLLDAKNPQDLQRAAQLLRQGKLVALPTETVYGLGANAFLEESVKGIYLAKGRPQDNPLIVHISQWEELEPLVTQIPPSAKALADAYWPGPMTMILPKSPRIPRTTSGGLDTVAIRMPSHPVAREVIRLAGVPIAAPSANLSGSPSPTTAQHCVHDLWGRVDAILDGGPCQVGVESTVLTLCTPVPRLLRPGAVTPEQLRAVLGELEVDPAVLHRIAENAVVSSPGMKYKHYAPKAHESIVQSDLEAFARYLQEHKEEGVWALCFEGEQDALPVPALVYGRREDPSSQAKTLFDCLRKLDELGAKRVYARCPSQEGVGLAVYNRLLRAAAFEEIIL